MAEGALRSQPGTDGWQIDSAGTGGWHVGDPPDRRAVAECRSHGIDISGLRARQVTPQDFRHFDLICAMDRSNLRALRDMAPADARAELCLYLDFAPEFAGQDVPDPYYAGGFDGVFGMVSAAARGLVAARG